jgi:hypothetical protein
MSFSFVKYKSHVEDGDTVILYMVYHFNLYQFNIC